MTYDIPLDRALLGVVCQVFAAIYASSVVVYGYMYPIDIPFYYPMYTSALQTIGVTYRSKYRT